MAGLVPIRSKVLNVNFYERDGKSSIVDAHLANELNLSTREIELVGVLEKDRFWKDMRRILFSDATVTVLGRVSVDGIREKWHRSSCWTCLPILFQVATISSLHSRP